jgi:site-specific DNA recombinase
MSNARKAKAPLRDSAALINGLAQSLAYYRVSTSEQANTSYDEDGFSIQAQREASHRKAADIGATIVDEYVERGKSARTTDRPELQKLLKRIKEDPDIQYVIVHKLDRFARNREDDVTLGVLFAKLGVRLISATENIDDTPSGKLVRGIFADLAEFYSANLSEEAKKGLRKKVEIGGTPGKAPLGYDNVRLKIREQGKDIGIVAVNDVAGPIVTRMFHWYDSGTYTISDVTDEANREGLRLPATKNLPERPVLTQTVQRILRNRYYAGWVTYNGVEYKGEHTPLVDEPTFERVQALLTARNLNKDKSKKRPHHLKGNLFCGRCGRRFGITAPTNRHGTTYAYFYCLGHQKDKNGCPQAYVPVGVVEEAVADYWRQVHIPTDRIQALRQLVISDFAGKHAEGQQEIERQEARIKTAERQQKKNKDAYYADAIGLEEFKADQARFRAEIVAAQNAIDARSVELDGITRSLDEALLLVEDPVRLYQEMPEGMKLLLTQAVFEKLWIVDEGVSGADLTSTFGELLTMEARIAWNEQREDEPDTYHRTEPSLIGQGTSWARLQAERPYGPIPMDSYAGPQGQHERTRAPWEGDTGSNLLHLVGLTGFEPATP